MKIKVLLFGMLAEISGKTKLEIENCKDTNVLLQLLTEKYPAINNCKYVVAVYKTIITENTTLNNGDTVALLPPFAGG